MKKTKLFLILTLTVTLTSAIFSASKTGKINYQGKLKQDGKLVNGKKNLKFKIFDALEEGSLLWESHVEPIIVKQGVFNYKLGEKRPLPGDIFDENDVFVEIAINSITLTPREEILRPPYAAKAGSVSWDRVTGIPEDLKNNAVGKWYKSPDGIYYNEGNVGVGTTLPETNFKVIGSGNNKHTAEFEGYNGYGIAIGCYENEEQGRLQSYSKKDGNKVVKDLKINADGGNVSIGEITATEKLEVKGNIKAEKFIGDGSSLTGILSEVGDGTITDEKISDVDWNKITNIPTDIIDGDDVGITSESDPTVLASVKDGVDWNEVSGIPTDIADGDDVGITSESDPTVPASIKDGVDWNEIAGIPTGITDGDDVGITSESDPTVPASIKDGVDWNEIAGIPTGITDGDDVGITSESDPTVPASIKDGVDWNEIAGIPTGITDGDDVGITSESDPTVPASIKDGVDWNEIAGIPTGITDGDDVGITSESDPTVPASIKDGVDWSEVAGIPTDIADGDDVGITSESDPTVPASIKDGVDWSEVTNIPEDILDGDNDTELWNNVNGDLNYNNGNIGIGTVNPTEKLEVNGTVKAAKFVGDGSGITGVIPYGPSYVSEWKDATNGKHSFDVGFEPSFWSIQYKHRSGTITILPASGYGEYGSNGVGPKRSYACSYIGNNTLKAIFVDGYFCYIDSDPDEGGLEINQYFGSSYDHFRVLAWR